MNKFVAVIFPDESKVYEGLRALGDLHDEASVTVFGTVVVERDKDGALSVKRRTDDAPMGTGLGAIVGALLGVFGGPVGAGLGMAGGTVLGAWRDLRHADVNDEFIEVVSRELSPGNCAVIAEVAEEWIVPIDTRMESLGGRIVREPREAFVDDLIEKEVQARKQELHQRKQELNARKEDFEERRQARREERSGGKAEQMEQKLTDEIDHAAQKLQKTADKARERLDQVKEEMQAKLEALQEQAAKAPPDVRRRIESRITELRSDFGEREKKLNRAFDMSREALQP